MGQPSFGSSLKSLPPYRLQPTALVQPWTDTYKSVCGNQDHSYSTREWHHYIMVYLGLCGRVYVLIW